MNWEVEMDDGTTMEVEAENYWEALEVAEDIRSGLVATAVGALVVQIDELEDPPMSGGS